MACAWQVIGGMTDSLSTLSTPKSLGEWHTVPVVETVRKYARQLRSQSDLVVLRAHISGLEENEVLNSVAEIPVSVTGHVHSGITEALAHDGRVLVRVKSYGEELGRLDLRVDTGTKAPVSWTWKRIPVDSAKIEPDPAVSAQVKLWEDKVAAQVDRPLAISSRAFNKADVKRLIEQAVREETHSDFAWMNMGGIRDTLPQGQLLDRQIWNIMPFDNDVLIGTFKGRDLPPVVVGDRKIDVNRDYTLAVSDYTAANQGTQENLRTTGLRFPKDAGRMRDILLDWFRRKRGHRKRRIVERMPVLISMLRGVNASVATARIEDGRTAGALRGASDSRMCRPTSTRAPWCSILGRATWCACASGSKTRLREPAAFAAM